jgi:hypothetical protein
MSQSRHTKAATEDGPSATTRPGESVPFWHPKQVTLHVWSCYPNPAGRYSGTNSLMRPFNR